MKEVNYTIRRDGLYLAYLKDEQSKVTSHEEWYWDGQYRTKEEFESAYKGFIRTHIFDDEDE